MARISQLEAQLAASSECETVTATVENTTTAAAHNADVHAAAQTNAATTTAARISQLEAQLAASSQREAAATAAVTVAERKATAVAAAAAESEYSSVRHDAERQLLDLEM